MKNKYVLNPMQSQRLAKRRDESDKIKPNIEVSIARSQKPIEKHFVRTTKREIEWYFKY